MSNQPVSTDALHNLLEQLFPETEISRSGVDLLAIQIADLEPERAFTRVAMNDQVIPERYMAAPQEH